MSFLDEKPNAFKLKIQKLKIWISTQHRKIQIRHAYHPMRIAMPVVFFTFLIAMLLGGLFFSGLTIVRSLHPSKVETVTADSTAITDSISSADEIEQTGEYFLAPFPALPGQEEMDFIIVADKYDRVIHLLKLQKGIWGVIKSYPVAIGEKPGRKEKEGDKKTPEGVYIIVDSLSPADIEKEFNSSAEMYGPISYVLNYPNREDSLAGRTGSGIWIHGTVDGKVPVDTKGCLEMHNNNIRKLSRFLGNGDLTPVVIHNNPTFNLERDIDLNKLWLERERVIDARNPVSPSTQFASAENAASDTLQTPPVDTINDKKSTEADLVETDSVVTAQNDSATSETEKQEVKIEVVAENDTAVNQIALADTTKSDKEVETTTIQISDSSAIINRILQWKEDWESADIIRYQSNYDTLRFNSGSFDWPTWKAKKIRTFKNYSTITISISRIKLEKQTTNRAEVLFFQKYQSDLFKAENGKKITLQKSDGNWKIVQELTVRY